MSKRQEPETIILSSYWPLCPGRADAVEAVEPGRVDELVRELNGSYPPGQAEACLWTDRDGQPAPVFVFERGARSPTISPAGRKAGRQTGSSSTLWKSAPAMPSPSSPTRRGPSNAGSRPAWNEATSRRRGTPGSRCFSGRCSLSAPGPPGFRAGQGPDRRRLLSGRAGRARFRRRQPRRRGLGRSRLPRPVPPGGGRGRAPGPPVRCAASRTAAIPELTRQPCGSARPSWPWTAANKPPRSRKAQNRSGRVEAGQRGHWSTCRPWPYHSSRHTQAQAPPPLCFCGRGGGNATGEW